MINTLHLLLLAVFSLFSLILIFWNRNRIITKAKKAIFEKNIAKESKDNTDNIDISNDKNIIIKNINNKIDHKTQESIDRSIKRVEILIEHEEYKEAEKTLVATLAIDKNSIQANILLASLYLKKKQYSKAEVVYKKLAELQNYQDPSVISNLAFCLFELNQIESSINYYEKALDLDKDNIKRYTNLAQVFFVTKNYSSAIELFEKANKMSYRDTEILFMLADTYREAKKYSEAKKNYKKILDLEPYNAEAKEEIAKIEIIEYN